MMVSQTTFLILLSWYSAIAHTEPNIIPRLGYGVLFEEADTVDMSSNYWRHSFLIKFEQPPADLGLEFYIDCNMTSEADESHVQKWCIDLESAIANHNAQIAYLVENIRKNEEVFKHVLPDEKYIDTTEKNTTTRKKRGLVDGIGKGMRFLFGTATDEDVQKMKTHLKFAAASYEKLKTYQLHLNSYLVKTNKRVDNAIQMLKFNHDIMQLAINNISNFYSNEVSDRLDDVELMAQSVLHLTSFTSALVMRMSQTVDQLILLQHQGAKKLHAVQSLLAGRLPLQLITPLDLRKMITDVRRGLKHEYKNFEVSVSNIEQFYGKNLISYAYDDSFLAIHIKVPISSLASKFTIYRSIVTSTPLTTDIQHNGNRSFVIEDLKVYFAIAEDESFYAELSEVDYLACTANSFKKCTRRITLRPIDHPSCILALYLNIYSDIIRLCNIKYIRNTVSDPLTYSLGNGNVLIRSQPNENEWIQTCGSRKKIVNPCMFCIMDNSCCDLSGNNFYIPVNIESCNDNNYTITVKHIQSVPFISLFYPNFTDDSIVSKTELDLDESIVDMDLIDRHWAMALEKDKEDKSDLDMLKWLIAQNSMKDDEDLFQIDQEKYNRYTVIGLFVAFGVMFAITFSCVFILSRKVSRLRQNLNYIMAYGAKPGKFRDSAYMT